MRPHFLFTTLSLSCCFLYADALASNEGGTLCALLNEASVKERGRNETCYSSHAAAGWSLILCKTVKGACSMQY